MGVLLAVACGSGDDGVDATATPSVQPTPTDATAIRDIDFAQDDTALITIAQLGSGSVVPPDILYADLTGDGREEAIVPISSEGTLGNIAYVVFTKSNGATTPILRRVLDRGSAAGGLVMAVTDGELVETIGEFGPDDAFCCPSFLRRTHFRWDGSVLQVEREERLPNPNRPKR